jgi:hypothetical protein
MVNSTIQKKGPNSVRNARRRLAKQDSAASAASGGGGDKESSGDEAMAVASVDAAELTVPSDSDAEQKCKKSKPDDSQPSASSAGAASSAAPGTLIAEPSLADLLKAMCNMNQNIDRRFDQFESRFAGCDRKIEAITTEFKDFQAVATAKFAAITIAAPVALASAAGQPVAAWPLPGAASASHAARAPTGHAARPVDQQPPKAAAVPPAEFGRKLFALGFPRALPRAGLIAFWEHAMTIVPPALSANAVFQGGTGKTFAVVFPTREEAKIFTAAITDKQAESCWTSPRVGEGKFKITFRAERTVAQRDRGRALSGAWQILTPLINASPALLPGMKYTTDPGRGSISVISGTGSSADMWDLVSLKPLGEGFSIFTHDDNLKHFGVTTSVIDAIRTASAASAAAQ